MKIELNMKETIVETKTRKIKCNYSRELAKDLSSFHNLDIESELELKIKREIRREVRKKKIENILKHIG